MTAAPVRQGGAEVRFTLSADATVAATVLNIAGRPVRTIARGRELAAGANVLLWDGRSDGGLPAPAGTYVVRVEAATGSGQQGRAIALLFLRR